MMTPDIPQAPLPGELVRLRDRRGRITDLALIDPGTGAVFAVNERTMNAAETCDFVERVRAEYWLAHPTCGWPHWRAPVPPARCWREITP